MCASDEAYILRGDRQTGETRFLKTPDATQHLNATDLSIMEAAICTLFTEFKNYAGSSNTLSREELKDLVIAQLPNYVKNAKEPGTVDKLMGELDADNDGELTFSEFWELIGKLASKQGGFSQ